jgi:hypothetical protein
LHALGAWTAITITGPAMAATPSVAGNCRCAGKARGNHHLRAGEGGLRGCPLFATADLGREETHTDMGRGVTDEAATVLTLLRRVTLALCVECLAELTAVPLAAMHGTTTGLLEAGSLIMAPAQSCPACQTHPALMLPGDSRRGLFRLIVVRRDRVGMLRNILDAIDRWPPGTAGMLDRRVGERRTQSQPLTLEQRRRPRRSEPDAMWSRHGFIVVETQRIPRQAVSL